MKKGGIIGTIVSLFVICVIFLLFLKAGSGNVVLGAQIIWDNWWYFANAAADKIAQTFRVSNC